MVLRRVEREASAREDDGRIKRRRGNGRERSAAADRIGMTSGARRGEPGGRARPRGATLRRGRPWMSCTILARLMGAWSLSTRCGC